eukprot:c49439_g1_i1.p1 GENE.c49439_g1_i1~~c49439_g1_i1.p1  ORF type:complete len:260 (+),score=13.34 c49439_g1_i1:32-781(+)
MALAQNHTRTNISIRLQPREEAVPVTSQHIFRSSIVSEQPPDGVAVEFLGTVVEPPSPLAQIAFCLSCDHPVINACRLNPCHHVFCLSCVQSPSTCPRCQKSVQEIERWRNLGEIYTCTVDACLRSYLTEKALVQHQAIRHPVTALATAPLNRPSQLPSQPTYHGAQHRHSEPQANTIVPTKLQQPSHPPFEVAVPHRGVIDQQDYLRGAWGPYGGPYFANGMPPAWTPHPHHPPHVPPPFFPDNSPRY